VRKTTVVILNQLNIKKIKSTKTILKKIIKKTFGEKNQPAHFLLFFFGFLGLIGFSIFLLAFKKHYSNP
jgi:hypothetical protein